MSGYQHSRDTGDSFKEIPRLKSQLRTMEHEVESLGSKLNHQQQQQPSSKNKSTYEKE